MKNIRFILTALLIGFIAVSCDEKPIDDLSGTYDDIARYDFTTVEQHATEKLGRGIKALVLTFKDADGHALEMRIGSAEWVLKANTYAATAAVAADKEFSAVLDGKEAVASGNLNVNLINDLYIFSGLLSTADGREFQCNYRGALAFEIGEDDPEASGYTIRFSAQPVFLTDAMGQVAGTVPGVMQYTFVVSDPAGTPAGQFVVVNAENMEASQLGGTYTVKENATEAGSMANGWKLPADWGGWSGGSWAADDRGAAQYITAGRIAIAVAEDAEGNKLYSFSGTGLTTTLGMNADGSSMPGTLSEVKIRFATIVVDGTPAQE
ncbi:MAG: hypothetical protein NC209_00665 [Alistipes sp.]|nr:hypothetical protein [Alistipes senegalensis]MCM1249645.1 hypothetical protein [Alistipes sp.]